MKLFSFGASAGFIALGQIELGVFALALALLYWISGDKA